MEAVRSKYVRESYEKLALETLKDSPAWELFIKALTEDISYVQDDVVFKMNGYSEFQKLIPEFIIEGYDPFVDYFQEGKVLKVLIDSEPITVSFTGAKISTDGVNFKKYETVTDEPFYIKFNETVPKSEAHFSIRNFYPNHPIIKSALYNLNLYGFDDEAVIDSDFFLHKSATSAFLIDFFLKKANVKYSIGYFFSDGNAGTEVKGSNDLVVRNGIKLTETGTGIYEYSSNLQLIPGKDFIIVGNQLMKIISVSGNSIMFEGGVPSGVYDIKRTDYLVSVSQERTLLSSLEIEYDQKDQHLMKWFLPRVLPVRCTEGFKGFVSVRISSDLRISDTVQSGQVYHIDGTYVQDFISWLENNALYTRNDLLVEKGTRVRGTVLSRNNFKEIILKAP